jgi:hypothetical protein
VVSVIALEESICPSIASIGIGLDKWTGGNLCLRTNVSSIKHVVAPESRNTKDSIELNFKWMLIEKEKSSADVTKLWEQ